MKWIRVTVVVLMNGTVKISQKKMTIVVGEEAVVVKMIVEEEVMIVAVEEADLIDLMIVEEEIMIVAVEEAKVDGWEVLADEVEVVVGMEIGDKPTNMVKKCIQIL